MRTKAQAAADRLLLARIPGVEGALIVQMCRASNGYLIHCEMPGVKKEEIAVAIDGIRSLSRPKLSRNGKGKKATGCCATSSISATSNAVSPCRQSWTSRHPWPHTTTVSLNSSWLRRRPRPGRGWLSGRHQHSCRDHVLPTVADCGRAAF